MTKLSGSDWLRLPASGVEPGGNDQIVQFGLAR